MNADPAYWAANVADLTDADLLRFIDAVLERKNRYEVAFAAAVNEARHRNLIEKRPPITGGQSTQGRKQ
jgi:hypothetical protein